MNSSTLSFMTFLVPPASAQLKLTWFPFNQQPIVGDRDAVRIARKIGQHALGPSEGPLRIDDPVGSAQWRESGGKCGLVV